MLRVELAGSAGTPENPIRGNGVFKVRLAYDELPAPNSVDFRLAMGGAPRYTLGKPFSRETLVQTYPVLANWTPQAESQSIRVECTARVYRNGKLSGDEAATPLTVHLQTDPNQLFQVRLNPVGGDPRTIGASRSEVARLAEAGMLMLYSNREVAGAQRDRVINAFTADVPSSWLEPAAEIREYPWNLAVAPSYSGILDVDGGWQRFMQKRMRRGFALVVGQEYTPEYEQWIAALESKVRAFLGDQPEPEAPEPTPEVSAEDYIAALEQRIAELEALIAKLA